MRKKGVRMAYSTPGIYDGEKGVPLDTRRDGVDHERGGESGRGAWLGERGSSEGSLGTSIAEEVTREEEQSVLQASERFRRRESNPKMSYRSNQGAISAGYLHHSVYSKFYSPPLNLAECIKKIGPVKSK